MKQYRHWYWRRTNIKYGLINEAETLVEAHEMPTDHKGGPGIMQRSKIVAAYLEKGPLVGICISFFSW